MRHIIFAVYSLVTIGFLILLYQSHPHLLLVEVLDNPIAIIASLLAFAWPYVLVFTETMHIR